MKFLIFSFMAIVPVLVSGFIFPQPMSIKNGLVQVTNAQRATLLNIKLDVGTTKDSRMSVVGLVFELVPELATYLHPKMPGADGPNPQLSSGVRTLNLIEEGSFIDMMGKKTVKTLNGCWEIVWRENAAFGSLICGFDVPDEYFRNDACLPKGRMYISFPVWTKVGLKDAQESKERVFSRTKDLIGEKESELDKMQMTSNPFMKAFHYRNALAAAEKYYLYDLKAAQMVPSDTAIIPLQDDLLLSTKGMVFSKERIYFHATHDLLGMATASPAFS